MQEIKISKGIKRVTIPQSASGQPTIVYKAKGRKKKKQSAGLRIFDRLLRRTALAGQTQSKEYLARHKRSNRKKRNGWMRDLSHNLNRSSDKARKKLKLGRIIMMRF